MQSWLDVNICKHDLLFYYLKDDKMLNEFSQALRRNASLAMLKTLQFFVPQSYRTLHYAVVNKVMYRFFLW